MGLELKDVCKNFGTKQAVKHLNLIINKPGVYGLLGTNGAGKTTTIRMILGIIKKTAGTITWNDKEVTRENVNFGYMPEERGVYPKTKIYDQLMYFAKLKGITSAEANKAIDYWLKRLQMEEYRDVLAEKLSKGNQQKIQFIIAVMNDPELIVLDEPFSGLDPVNTETLSEVMKELIAKGKYIIMSSHQMSSIEEFCTDLTILNKGDTVLQGNLEKIKNSYSSEKLELIVNQDIDNFVKEENLEIIENKDNHYLIKQKGEKQGEELLKKLINSNIRITKFEMKKPTLNEIFIEKVGDVK
jgi:ABC-2 type transport system ATP-binding protein